MRDSYYLPAGSVFSDHDETAIEFAGPGENATSALIFFATFLPLRILFEHLVAIDNAHPAVLLASLLFPVLKYVLVVGFGVHYCTRFTLMNPEARRRALWIFFLVGIPLSFLPYAWVLCLAAPHRCWDAFVSWLSYPAHYAPGLYRSPVGPPWVRRSLSVSFAFLTAFTAIAPVLFITEHEER